MRGVSSLDLDPGDYTIEPSEWRRDAGQQLSNLTSGSDEGDEPVWHLHDVETASGTRVLEIVDDRRAMEGTFDTSGRQFLFRSPDREPLMAIQREGALTSNPATLREVTTNDVLGTWENSFALFPLFGSWQLEDPGGEAWATAKWKRSLRGLMYPTHVVRSSDGAEIGRFTVGQDGLFYDVEVTVAESAIPPEVILALAFGIAWAVSLSQ